MCIRDRDKVVLVTDHPVVAEDAPYIKHLVGGIAVEVDLLIDVGFVVLFPDDIQFLMFHFYFLISSIRKAGSPFMDFLLNVSIVRIVII